MQAWKLLGTNPVPMPLSELYSALESGAVDAQVHPIEITYSAKFYEVQKYCSLTNHMWDGWWFLVNRRAWSRVPGSMQESVAGIVNAACMAEREDVAQQNIALRTDLAGAGLVFNEVDQAPFREKLSTSGYYREWKSKFGEDAWRLLEEAAGTLA